MKPENRDKLRIPAAILLLVVMFATASQFISIYQISNQLVSPMIPENALWEINKQFVFAAFVYTISNILGSILYFLRQYLWVIIVISVTLIGSRFIYWPY